MECIQLFHRDHRHISEFFTKLHPAFLDKSDRTELAKNHELIYNFLYLIGEHGKIPLLNIDENFSLACIAMLLSFHLATPQHDTLQIPSGEQKTCEFTYYILEGNIEKLYAQAKSKHKRKKTSMNIQNQPEQYEKESKDIVSNKPFNSFSSCETPQLLKNSTYFKIQTESITAFKNEILSIYDEKSALLLSDHFGFPLEEILSSGIHKKIMTYYLPKGQKINLSKFPSAMIYVKAGEILIKNQQINNRFTISDDSCYDLSSLTDNYQATVLKDTLMLRLPKRAMAQFLKKHPNLENKYFSCKSKVTLDRTIFYQRQLSLNRNENGKQVLEFTHLVQQKKNRFSKYHHRHKTVHESEVEFMENKIYEKMIESKERVLTMQRSRQKVNKCEKIFEYLENSKKMKQQFQQNHLKKKIRKKITRPSISVMKNEKIFTLTQKQLTQESLTRKQDSSYCNRKVKEMYLNIDDTGIIQNCLLKSGMYNRQIDFLIARKNKTVEFRCHQQDTLSPVLKSSRAIEIMKKKSLTHESYQEIEKQNLQPASKKHKIFSRNKYGRIITKKV